MNHNQYVNEIDDNELKSTPKVYGDLKKVQTRLLRSIISQIHWANSQTRPDLCFDTLDLSVERNKATGETLKRAKKALKKLQAKDSAITFKRVGENIKIVVYSDAAHCNLSDGASSTQGHVVLIEGDIDTCVVDWGSTKIKRKVSSTLEAEMLALKESLNTGIYIGCLMSEFLFNNFKENQLEIEAFTDNLPVENSIRSSKQVSEKRLRVDVGEVQRLLEDREVKDIKWISKDDQLANGLTKRGAQMDDLLQLMIPS